MKRNTAPSMPLRTLFFRFAAIIIGLVVIVIGYQERSKITHIQAVGERAVVDPIEEYTERTSRGSKTYSADFTFTTAKGVKIQRRKQFPGELLADFENETPVEVRYDPADPYEFIFKGEEPSLLPFVIGIAFLIGAFVLIRAPSE